MRRYALHGCPLIEGAPRDGGLVAWELLSGLRVVGRAGAPGDGRARCHSMCLLIRT